MRTNTRLLLQCYLEKDRKKRIGQMSTARFLLAQPAMVNTTAGVTLRFPDATLEASRCIPRRLPSPQAAALEARVTLDPEAVPDAVDDLAVHDPAFGRTGVHQQRTAL